MKNLLAVIISLLMLGACAAPAAADLTRCDVLDVALPFLEKGNVFLDQYNALTGAELEPVFATGTPYLFGGKYSPKMMEKLPDYARRAAYEDTEFFRRGHVYLYGFDCSGFIKYIHLRTGRRELPWLSEMLNAGRRSPANILFSEDEPDFATLHEQLIPGDLFVIRTKYNHVMMYIGTLRDFGLGGDSLALSPYLDYPLCIQCGMSPVFGRRMENWLKKHRDDPYYQNVETTDGGVCVSILGVPLSAAPHRKYVQGTDFAYFTLKNTTMTIYDLADHQWVVRREGK